MEKRTLLAFLLVFVVLIGWSLLVEKPRQSARMEQAREERARRLAVAESLAALGDTTGARAALEGRPRESAPDTAARPEAPARTRAQETGGAQAPEAKPGRAFSHAIPDTVDPFEPAAVITSDRYRAEIGRVGGALTSWRLLEFNAPDGGPVELVKRRPVHPNPDRRNVVYEPPRDFAPGGPHVGLCGPYGVEWLSDVVFEREDGLDRDIVLGRGNPAATVTLRAVSGSLEVTKTYVFHRDRYEFEAEIRVRGIGPADEIDAYRVGWLGGLSTTERDVGRDLGASNVAAMVGADMRREGVRGLDRGETKQAEGTVRWAGVQTKYFILAMIPRKVRSGEVEIWGDGDLGIGQVAVQYPVRDLQERASSDLEVYFGPIDYNRLKAYDVGLEKTVNLGPKILRAFSSLVLSGLLLVHKAIPNYGLVIIVMSVLTKVLFYRLTHKSMKSMKDMQKVQPKLAALREKYKDDRQKLNEATMKLYKEHKINPLGGCLPLLLQMPVFIALYRVLANTIELRGAPFVLWINNLAAEDTLFYLPFSIPFLGDQFNPLPLLMGVTTLLQSFMGGSPTGGGGPEGMPGATSAMKWIMPGFMLFIFYHMPSGLVLYWLVNNLLSIAQQWYINKGETEAPASA
jgi:YidC/Oxa1 family membrane protein insertase